MGENMEQKKTCRGKKRGGRICHMAAGLLLASSLVFFLPNAGKIRRQMCGETSLHLTKEEIHVVELENEGADTPHKGSTEAEPSMYGSYCLLGDFPATKLELTLRGDPDEGAKNVSCKVYYIEEPGQEYSEESSLELELSRVETGSKNGKRGGGEKQDPGARTKSTWQMYLPREVAALRIDLPCAVTEVKAPMAPFRWYWLNLLPLYFLMITCRLYRRWMGDGGRTTTDNGIDGDDSGAGGGAPHVNREMLVALAKNDLRSRYAGSALGMVWAFVQPLLTILVMWYVFQIGFRNPPVRRWPFIPWFVTGYIPWMFFSDTLLGMAVSMREYSYLVKKVRFPLQILPGVKFLASLTIHGFFLVFMFFLLQLYGFRPTLHWLQLLYYTFCLGCLIYALGMLFAALSVLFSDFSNLLGVLLQVLFWYTPIFWDYVSLQRKVLWIFKANPMFYVVKGYRDSFLGAGTFAADPAAAILFWAVTCMLLILGSLVFARTRPHFADLL